jgi:crotonobetainyl-CoA:carnitine CoA-transferase CaiB-like acyl-CoA transferase
LAQLEGMICFIGEEVLAAQVRGSDPPRRGNRSEDCWPQGCYRCDGDDRWLAVSIAGDREWRTFCDVAGLSELRALDMATRKARAKEIDGRIATWAAVRDRDSLVRLLQAHGIAAAPAADARDVVTDEHLSAREFWADIQHVDAGRHSFPGLPVHLSLTPARYELPAPGLGEHNREVLAGLLGLSEDSLEHLSELRVIADQPPS